mmetsp:Transcript_31202/g.70098  ORF Transcript_31202/g.70098 Transcript_31202/m.70098 type:complete len:332 (-) Transcript_31202:223-1218(-)
MAHLMWFVGEDSEHCGRTGLGLSHPTFLEAYHRTGRLVNITCTPFKTKVKGSPPLILNHLTAPNVTLASAVCASSCVPMLIEPVALLEKGPDGALYPYEAHTPTLGLAQPIGRSGSDNSLLRNASRVSGGGHGNGGDGGDKSGESDEMLEFDIPLDNIRMRDGSFESDVPVQAMSELFNCHFTVVSQVNPHIVPFFYHSRGRDGRPSTWRLWAGGWRGGFVLSALELWLKEDLLKCLRVLAGLDLLIEVFGVNWSYLYLQEARGDVTLIPDVRLRDYTTLIDNLTNLADLERRIKDMERNVWECMSRIEHRMAIQKILDRACEQLGISDLH